MRAAGGRRSAAAALLTGTVLLAGCGTASDPSPPTGVDQLVVPTPSPDPADFVADLDNPWLALGPGTVRRYDGPGAGATTRVEVAGGPVVDGVATTAVETRTAGRGRGAGHTDWLAQDTDGNVWWFGRAGEWVAGRDGARAGLAMTAAPRVGDGYRPAYAPGVVEPRAQVLTTDGSTDAPGGAVGGVLVVEVTSPLTPGLRQELSFVRGLGLVGVTTTSGDPGPGTAVPERSLELADPS